MQSSHFTVGHSDEILPGIFLGGIYATTPEALARHQIQAVLNVAGSHTSAVGRYPLHDHTILEIDDVPDASREMTKKVFPVAFKFLDKYAHPNSKHRRRVLVHCMAGVSRSTTVLTAWLMKTFGMSMDDALKLIKSKRPIVNPNHGFIRALREYEHFVNRWLSSRPGKQGNGVNETAAKYSAKPKNASQEHFHSQAAMLTPSNNLASDERVRQSQGFVQGFQSGDTFGTFGSFFESAQPLSFEGMVGAPISSQMVDDELPNRWNNELKGMWKEKYRF